MPVLPEPCRPGAPTVTPRLLAFDTATERMVIALATDGIGSAAFERRITLHEAAGGAQASALLIPAIQALLAGASTTLQQLDAIAFGRGPGAFTGLRTACAVAQGLAFGAGLPVLAIDTLQLVAADAAAGIADDDRDAPVWVAVDARMNEIYAACYRREPPADGPGGEWHAVVAPMLVTPEALAARWDAEPPRVVAGNALKVFGDRLPTGAARRFPDAEPRAAGLMPIATRLWQAGAACDPALALPFYLRDKVALTTAEREDARRARQTDAVAIR
jgi:tRNA threonylcarbamoyladenosine biosynthesis protein TsaB